MTAAVTTRSIHSGNKDKESRRCISASGNFDHAH